jgi:hypothetical protein
VSFVAAYGTTGGVTSKTGIDATCANERPAAKADGHRRACARGGCDDDGVKIVFQVVVFDAADLAPESSFWAGVLGGTVDAEDDWHMVLVDGQPRIGVQLAPNHVPPDWPDGTPQQIHLDLWVVKPVNSSASIAETAMGTLRFEGSRRPPGMGGRPRLG